MMKLRSRFPVLRFCLCLLVVASTGWAGDYGAKVRFKKDAPVAFDDFELIYLGERRVASSRFPRGFLYHDFRVAGGPATQTISWSSGTGDIGPTLFRVGPKQFALELRRSDKLGPLKPNELVVSRAP